MGALATPSNSVYLFVYTDPNSPLATCTLTLNERLQGPDPATNGQAAGGDGAVTLTWTAASPGSTRPRSSRSCAPTTAATRSRTRANKQIYSVCENGVAVAPRPHLGRLELDRHSTAASPSSTDMATFALQTNLGDRLPPTRARRSPPAPPTWGRARSPTAAPSGRAP